MLFNKNCRPEVGDLIRRKAFEAGCNISQLADRCRVDRKVLSHIIFHRHRARMDTFAKIGDTLGCRDELLKLAGYNSNRLPKAATPPDLMAEASLKHCLQWVIKQPPEVQRLVADIVGSLTQFCRQMEA